MQRYRVTSRQKANDGSTRSVLVECSAACIPKPEEIDAGLEILARFDGFALLLNEGDRVVREGPSAVLEAGR